MRFDFTFHADDVSELSDAMNAVIQMLPKNLFDGKNQGFKIDAMPTSFPTGWNNLGTTTAPIVLDNSEPREAVNDEAGAEKTRRNRRTKAEMEAARLKEQLQASLGQTPVEEPAAEPEEEEVEGDYSYEPEPEEEEVASPPMAPAEAKLKALEILRDCYVLPGGAAAVKALQASYGVKKFSDVQDSDGPGLLNNANDLLFSLPTAAAA